MRAWWLGWLVAAGVVSCTADDPKLTTPERIEKLKRESTAVSAVRPQCDICCA